MADAGMGVLAGKAALVTGGASGIGAATAGLLAARGARVAVADLDTAAAEQLAAGMPTGQACAIGMDVADEAAVEQGVTLTIERLGGLDILVNSAGISIRQPA